MSSSGARRAALAAAAGVLLLLANTLVRVSARPLHEDTVDGRYWEEANVAAVACAEGRFPWATYEVGVVFFSRDPRAAAFREALTSATRGMAPWQAWRTVDASALVSHPLRPVRVADDRGRTLALAGACRVLGGLPPYLLFWIGFLLAVPVFAWTAAELEAAGHGRAALVLLPWLGALPFLADTLALAYSPVAFTMLAVLGVVPLAVHAALAPVPTVRGLAWRVAGAAVLLGVCAFGRRAALTALPGYLLALAVGLARLRAARAERGITAAAAGLAFGLVAPAALVLVLAPRLDEVPGGSLGRRHRPWMNVWQGLGDFDRTKGYVWADRKAGQFLLEAGQETRALSPRAERLFRDKVLSDVRADPGWYTGILLRRLGATLTQWKLWPWAPWSGRSFAPSTAPNEGAIDSYYELATTVDHVGVGPWRVELPVLLLLVPTLVLLVRRAKGPLLVLAAVAVTTLGTPVLVSTAGALETQAFALVYVLGAALLVRGGGHVVR